MLREREAKGLSDRINFVTVVTDLSTCHNTWFHKGVDRCFVATEEAAALAQNMGLRPEQVDCHLLNLPPPPPTYLFTACLPAHPPINPPTQYPTTKLSFSHSHIQRCLTWIPIATDSGAWSPNPPSFFEGAPAPEEVASAARAPGIGACCLASRWR